MTDPTGTYRELAERYGLDIETIGGGAQMLSRYFASGTGVHVTCLDGGGLPTSDNWHIGVHPADWDGDGDLEPGALGCGSGHGGADVGPRFWREAASPHARCPLAAR